MKDPAPPNFTLPLKQQAIRDRCFHPSGTFVEFPLEDVETSIPERFEKVVRMYPHRLAYKVGDRSLTYDALNQAANQVARTVVNQCGDQLGTVLLLADHHPQTMIAGLGILKAGKILVPVDPLLPIDRLCVMAETAKAQAILAHDNHLLSAARLASDNRAVINLDGISSALPSDNLGAKILSQNPAVVRYTSGSTGRPKGVVRSHRRTLFQSRTLINGDRLCFEDRSIVLRSFAVTTTDTLTSLMAGSTASPYDVNGRGLRELGNFLRAERITHFVASPSIFRYFVLELGDGKEFPDLRIIRLGGEPLFRADVELFNRHFSRDVILLNQLSGTEMGTICQFWIDKDSPIPTSIVPVGYPVHGKQVLLLDDERKEVAAGEVGEIVVASRYLSTQYLNRQELTDQPFVSDGADSETQLYFSGDLGRRLSDGCVVYIGRKDDQVKIRGFKVDLGEIEAVLTEHPNIRQSAVKALDRANGHKYIAAYVVPRFQPAPTVTELNIYLRKKLPSYMIPAAYVYLDSLPLTNAKVDRRLLPEPNNARPALEASFSAPSGDVETRLAEIWQELLGVEQIGIDDNFFDLGGHSLIASQLISRVIQVFHLELPIEALFEAPTIAEMALVIDRYHGNPASDAVVARLLEQVEAMTEEEAKQMATSLDREIGS